MTEETNMQEVVEEIKGASEEELKQVIERWFESTRTQGLKLGAKMISIVVSDIIKKHTKKAGKVSLNDYRRMTDDILKVIIVQLTEQNDSEGTPTEEHTNDK